MTPQKHILSMAAASIWISMQIVWWFSAMKINTKIGAFKVVGTNT